MQFHFCGIHFAISVALLGLMYFLFERELEKSSRRIENA